MIMDMLGGQSEDAEAWVSKWSASISERAERAQALSQRVAVLTVAASGAGGAVRVTVAGSGAVTDIRLEDRVSGWPADRIAAEILAVMRRAQGLLAGEVARVAAQTVGASSDTGRAVVASFERRFPVQPDDDAEPPPSDGGSRRAPRGRGDRDGW